MKENPNYYGILPAFVRYSKDVCANAKLLYTELTALTNKEGYCYANNGYFAELYGVSEKSISNWIKELNTAGFIRSEVTKNSNGTYRKIFLTDGNNFLTGQKKTSIGCEKKSSNGLEENFYPKEYYNNNTININNNKESTDLKKSASTSKKEKQTNYDYTFPINFDDELKTTFETFLKYKIEKKKAYKGNTSVQLLINQISKYVDFYDAKLLNELILVCMANNWDGIIFDKLPKMQDERNKYKTNVNTNPETGYTPKPLNFKIF